MTKKLTKNDSMRNEAQGFKTIVAVFEAILSRNNVHLDYFANWRKRRELNYSDTIYTQWLNWARQRDPKKWIIAAFLFDEQNLPIFVWYRVNSNWEEWLKKNLNK